MLKRFLFLFSALLLCVSLNTFAQNDDSVQDFTLVNSTGVVIHHVYISPHDVEDWEEDVLGEDVFMEDTETTITFAPIEDVCSWDLKIDDSEGNAIIWYNIDLCKWSVVTLHWDGEKATATFE